MKAGIGRSLKWYRENGYIADVVERFVAQAGPHGKRFDWCGVADIVALPIDGRRTYGGVVPIEFCQSTTGTNLSKHRREYETEAERRAAIAAIVSGGHLFVVHGWRKLKSAPGRRLWYPKMNRALRVADSIEWDEWSGLGEYPWR